MKKILYTFLLLLTSLNLLAQNHPIEMADTMRSNGKIYVVVACIVIILAGLLFYLFSIDRRLKILEKKNITSKN